MEYTEKIQSIVEEALTEKTFSLEIITKIKALKDDFDGVSLELKLNKEALVQSNKFNTELMAKNEVLNTQNAGYKSREEALALKEKGAEKKEYELTYQTKRADEIKELFQIVFKNPVMQESVMKNGNVPNGNGSTAYTNENITSTKTVL